MSIASGRCPENPQTFYKKFDQKLYKNDCVNSIIVGYLHYSDSRAPSLEEGTVRSASRAPCLPAGAAPPLSARGGFPIKDKINSRKPHPRGTPLLLSFTSAEFARGGFPATACKKDKVETLSFNCLFGFSYARMSITTPEPTVLPPSRIAKRRPFSIAIGVMSSTFISTLSPGRHISTPSGRPIVPVTSVVLK